jgi:hypothetical protein
VLANAFGMGISAEIERGHRPYDIHDPHPLGVSDLVDGDDNGADESDPQRDPRHERKHVPNPFSLANGGSLRDEVTTADC